MKRDNIAAPVINRLPKYYRCVDDLYRSNCIRVSSSTLSERLGFTASQIRQDFSCFGEFGQQGYGYNVKKLRYEIQEILGMNNGFSAILVGCGNLGHALIRNFDFKRAGFELKAIFDSRPELVGAEMEGHPVRHVDTLKDYAAAAHPDVAVMTVPSDAAQETAELLAASGIRGLWNFTNRDLRLDDKGIQVENVLFSDSLMVLCYKISDDEY